MKHILLLFTITLIFNSCGMTFIIPKNDLKNKLEINKKLSENPAVKRSPIPNSTEEYIKMYKDIAIDKMFNYKIPASITLAQGILESGIGKSDLAVIANNHFGIKCSSGWNGLIYHKDDDKEKECFKAYTQVEYSFDDHSKLLLRSRYSKLFLLDIKDYKGWAKTLKDCGYATNPKYPESLISLIEKFKLYQYDSLFSPSEVEITDTIADEYSDTTANKYLDTIAIKRDSSNNVSPSVETPVISNNEILSRKAISSFIASESKDLKQNIHIVKKGDTLYNIAKRYNISIDLLMKLNSMTTKDIKINQKLIIK